MRVKDHNQTSRRFLCKNNELDSIRQFLEQMALEGWVLDHKQGVHYHFWKCEPQRIRYTVEITAEKFGGYQFRNATHESYLGAALNLGWHFVCVEGRMQIFNTLDEQAPPIEPDPAQKLRQIHKMMWREVLWGWICCPLVFLVFFLFVSTFNVTKMLSSSFFFLELLIGMPLALSCCYQLLAYWIWYRRATRQVESGHGFSDYNSFLIKWPVALLAIVDILWLGGWVYFSLIPEANVRILLLILLGTGIAFAGLTALVKWVMRRTQFSAPDWRLWVSAGNTGRLLCYICMMIVIWFGVNAAEGLKGAQEVTYRQGETTVTETIYHDKLPLSMADLGMTTDSSYSSEKIQGEHFIIWQDHYSERPPYGDEVSPYMAYTIYQTKLHWAYNLLLNEKVHNVEFFGDYREVDPKDFGAEKAYRSDDGMGSRYYILYRDRIVDLRISFTLDKQQMQVVGKKLRGS